MTNSLGRPLALDERKKHDICTVLSTGGTRDLAARYVGCHVLTIHRTARRDPEFAERLRRAEAGAEMTHLGLIRQGAHKSWRASAWLLERTHAGQYGKRGQDGLTGEQLLELVRDCGDEVDFQIHDHKLRRNVARCFALVTRRLRRALAAAGARVASETAIEPGRLRDEVGEAGFEASQGGRESIAATTFQMDGPDRNRLPTPARRRLCDNTPQAESDVVDLETQAPGSMCEASRVRIDADQSPQTDRRRPVIGPHRCGPYEAPSLSSEGAGT